MTTLSLKDWSQSPQIMVGAREHRRLTTAALIDVEQDSDQVDFLLYELDRAVIVEDALLPADIVRTGSVVRYRLATGEERTVKLVLPEAVAGRDSYPISVTSKHGAALLGLRPGQLIAWIDAGGSAHSVEVLRVANTA
jgi:regulator of nucleoside diphosphate kinase